MYNVHEAIFLFVFVNVLCRFSLIRTLYNANDNFVQEHTREYRASTMSHETLFVSSLRAWYYKCV